MIAMPDSVGDDWREEAMCFGQNPARWFPSGSFSSNARRSSRISEKMILEDRAYAKKVCAGCPVKEPCLDFALKAKEPWGIYGGVSEYDRRQMRRRMWRALKRARREGKS